MMGAPYMNGQTQQPQPVPMSDSTPLAYYQPVAITPGTIKWVAACVVGLVGFLASAPIAERYINPAKNSDLQALTAIVQVIQTSQKESHDALARLTMAVDNLSGIVAGLKQTAAVVVPKAKR